MCACVLSVHVLSIDVLSPEEGVGSPRGGGTGSCELPNVAAEN